MPSFLANSRIIYKIHNAFNLQYELDFIGTQYGEDGGDIKKISPTFIQNIRISYNLPVTFAGTELFLRINNLVDTERIREIGLPDFGRTVLLGFSFNM